MASAPVSRFSRGLPGGAGSYVPSAGVLGLRATPGDGGRKRRKRVGRIQVAVQHPTAGRAAVGAFPQGQVRLHGPAGRAPLAARVRVPRPDGGALGFRCAVAARVRRVRAVVPLRSRAWGLDLDVPSSGEAPCSWEFSPVAPYCTCGGVRGCGWIVACARGIRGPDDGPALWGCGRRPFGPVRKDGCVGPRAATGR